MMLPPPGRNAAQTQSPDIWNRLRAELWTSAAPPEAWCQTHSSFLLIHIYALEYFKVWVDYVDNSGWLLLHGTVNVWQVVFSSEFSLINKSSFCCVSCFWTYDGKPLLVVISDSCSTAFVPVWKISQRFSILSGALNQGSLPAGGTGESSRDDVK